MPVEQVASFRRSMRLKITPVVLLLLGAVVLAHPRPAAIVPVVFAGGIWTMLAAIPATQRLVISADSISMHGYIGGPIVTRKEDVTSCRYVRVMSHGRGLVDFSVLEILDNQGHGIRVWRYGWGRRRRQQYQLLGDWLDESGVQLSPATSDFLTSARR